MVTMVQNGFIFNLKYLRIIFLHYVELHFCFSCRILLGVIELGKWNFVKRSLKDKRSFTTEINKNKEKLNIKKIKYWRLSIEEILKIFYGEKYLSIIFYCHKNCFSWFITTYFWRNINVYSHRQYWVSEIVQFCFLPCFHESFSTTYSLIRISSWR